MKNIEILMICKGAKAYGALIGCLDQTEGPALRLPLIPVRG
jgi:hypothetical protein